MNAAPAAPAARLPDRGGNRAVAALAVSLGLHMLVAVFWLQDRRTPALQPQSIPAPRTVTILLTPPRAPARTPLPAHASARSPEHTHAPASAVPADRAARSAPSQNAAKTAPAARAPIIHPPQQFSEPAHAQTTSTLAPPSAPITASPAPPPDAPSPKASVPGDAAALVNDPSLSVNGNFTAGLAKRQAGRIDRELRGGKSGVPLDANTPWSRFVKGLEDAHVERSNSAVMDSYTAPDGVIIYRLRVGNRTVCRRTGSIGQAGPVSCPTGVVWQRED